MQFLLSFKKIHTNQLMTDNKLIIKAHFHLNEPSILSVQTACSSSALLGSHRDHTEDTRHPPPPSSNRMFLFLLFPCFCVLRVVPRCAVSHFNLSQTPRLHIAFSLRYDCWTSPLTSQCRSEASCYLLAPSHRHALSFCPSNTHTYTPFLPEQKPSYLPQKKKI